MEHPITPPPDLIEEWRQKYTTSYDLARQAARWGADQELEACCEWLKAKGFFGTVSDLRAARCLKQPSLAEQALTKINAILGDPRKSTLKDEIEALELSRHALERLKELEKGNE